MTLFYSDASAFPLPPGHPFPAAKYGLLRQRLLSGGAFEARELHVAEPASDAEITRVHCPDYLARVVGGTLDAREIRAIGFPWSEAMATRARRSAGATLMAAREALTRGWSANLGGGTHHAFRERGSGYCVFNDCAIAARAMQVEAGLQRIAMVDCDVHQGNGTAALFAGDESVFTFSMHAAKNFPARKERSDLDIELQDKAGDAEYLWHLERGLDETLERARPQLVFYLAGADPYAGDRLGRLELSKEGLARRDAHVLSTLASRGIPVAIVMAGGYARDLGDVAEINTNTLLAAKRAES
jgi:acetoin utilization deacetylase AcuC-like enzyme